MTRLESRARLFACCLSALAGFVDAIGFILTNLVVAAILFITAHDYWIGRREAPGPIIGLTVLYAAVGVSFVACARASPRAVFLQDRSGDPVRVIQSAAATRTGPCGKSPFPRDR